jgi:EAL domain-containing protein (putative c-di-GMP-specific phosphodiesterase class I)
LLAEGVEDQAQMSFLRERGCDQIQGYYFSKPLIASEIAALLPAAPVSASPEGRAIQCAGS